MAVTLKAGFTWEGGSVSKNPGCCWLSIAAFCNWTLQKRANKLCQKQFKRVRVETQSPVDFQAARSSSHLQAQQERSTIIREDGRNGPLQKRCMLSAREEAGESRSWGDVSWVKSEAGRRAQAESSFLVPRLLSHAYN